MITEVMSRKLGNWEKTNSEALYARLDENKGAPIRARIYALCYGVRHDLVAALAAVATPLEDGAVLIANVVGASFRLLASIFNYEVCIDYSFQDAWNSVTNTLESASRAVIAVGMLIPNLLVNSCFRIASPYYVPTYSRYERVDSASPAKSAQTPSPAKRTSTSVTPTPTNP